MHDLDEKGYEKRARAGLIPFLRDENGELHYLMMVSSDPKFGGHRPMISKGKIEPGETKLSCALREATEELGFKERNARGKLIEIADERVTLYSGTYELAVFAVEVMDRYDFDKWCDETEFTLWLTAEQFRARGRRDHIKYVEKLEKIVKKHPYEGVNASILRINNEQNSDT